MYDTIYDVCTIRCTFHSTSFRLSLFVCVCVCVCLSISLSLSLSLSVCVCVVWYLLRVVFSLFFWLCIVVRFFPFFQLVFFVFSVFFVRSLLKLGNPIRINDRDEVCIPDRLKMTVGKPSITLCLGPPLMFRVCVCVSRTLVLCRHAKQISLEVCR